MTSNKQRDVYSLPNLRPINSPLFFYFEDSVQYKVVQNEHMNFKRQKRNEMK